MRKYFIVCLLLYIFCFSVNAQTSAWGNWYIPNSCLKGIQARVKMVGINNYANSSAKYMWVFSIYNGYTKPIHFNLNLLSPEGHTVFENGERKKLEGFVGRISVQPNQSLDWGGFEILLPDANTVYFWIRDVRFGDDDIKAPYAIDECGHLTGVNSSFTGNNNNIASNSQAEQQAQLTQQAQQQREQQEKHQAQQQQQAQRQNALNEQRQRQLADLDAAGRKQNAAWTSVSDGISSIGDMIVKNMMENNIRSNEAERDGRFRELTEKVNSKNGSLIDCSECNGLGYAVCDKCNGNGFKNCDFCKGSGQSNCTLCGGKGTFLGRTCSVCGGSGSLKCSYCGGKGKNVCADCNGLGKQQCVHCRGTGKEFKEGEETLAPAEQNNTSYAANEPTTSNYTNSATLTAVTPVNTELGISVRDCLTKATQYQNSADYPQAIKWYKMAADQDVTKINTAPIYLALAQNNLAEFYRQGVGTPMDLQQAFFYYKKAADIGFMPAFFSVARCYENGYGVNKNLNEAISWYKKAAEDKYNFSAEVAKQATDALKRLGQ
jgi:type II secretory pathway pseudopilin PulG